MDYWDQLGISETANKRDIKRAYAKKLKTTRPDQDPEGFKALHAAYEQALWFVKYSSAIELTMDEEPSAPAVDSDTPDETELQDTDITQLQSSDEVQLNGANPTQADSFAESGPNQTGEHDSNTEMETTPEDQASGEPQYYKMQNQDGSVLVFKQPGSKAIVVDDLEGQTISEQEQQQIDDLLKQAKALLVTEYKKFDSNQWRFLVSSHVLLNDAVRIKIGTELLADIISHHKKEQKVVTSNNFLSDEIITLLDDRFLWSISSYPWIDTIAYEDYWEMMTQVSPEMRRGSTRVQGGNLIRNERSRVPNFGETSNNAGDWSITYFIVGFLILSALGRLVGLLFGE